MGDPNTETQRIEIPGNARKVRLCVTVDRDVADEAIKRKNRYRMKLSPYLNQELARMYGLMPREVGNE